MAKVSDPVQRLERLLDSLERFHASDLHLKANSPPIVRVAGSCRLLDMPSLSSDIVRQMVTGILNEEQIQEFTRRGNLDLAYTTGAKQRFRMNIFRERGEIAIAARRVLTEIPSFDDLHLPPRSMKRLAAAEQGLILLGGATGSGKSTTIASLVDAINRTRRCHIITVEDPIEYLHGDHKGFVNQRELGQDVADLHEALRSILRQDPDVIVVGEMRDAATFEFGLSAAETGHLVFGTLHAFSVVQCFGRILSLFPPDRHNAVRMNLHFNLRAIVCQKLLPSVKEGIDRVPAVEVMIANPIVRKLIMEGQDAKIGDVIRGAREEGMQDFTQSLHDLIRGGFIDEEIGLQNAPSREALQMMLQGISLDDNRRIIG